MIALNLLTEHPSLCVCIMVMDRPNLLVLCWFVMMVNGNWINEYV